MCIHEDLPKPARLGGYFRASLEFETEVARPLPKVDDRIWHCVADKTVLVGSTIGPSVCPSVRPLLLGRSRLRPVPRVGRAPSNQSLYHIGTLAGGG